MIRGYFKLKAARLRRHSLLQQIKLRNHNFSTYCPKFFKYKWMRSPSKLLNMDEAEYKETLNDPFKLEAAKRKYFFEDVNKGSDGSTQAAFDLKHKFYEDPNELSVALINIPRASKTDLPGSKSTGSLNPKFESDENMVSVRPSNLRIVFQEIDKAKILSFLDEKVYQKYLGSSKESVNVHTVKRAATDIDLSVAYDESGTIDSHKLEGAAEGLFCSKVWPVFELSRKMMDPFGLDNEYQRVQLCSMSNSPLRLLQDKEFHQGVDNELLRKTKIFTDYAVCERVISSGEHQGRKIIIPIEFKRANVIKLSDDQLQKIVKQPVFQIFAINSLKRSPTGPRSFIDSAIIHDGASGMIYIQLEDLIDRSTLVNGNEDSEQTHDLKVGIVRVPFESSCSNERDEVTEIMMLQYAVERNRRIINYPDTAESKAVAEKMLKMEKDFFETSLKNIRHQISEAQTTIQTNVEKIFGRDSLRTVVLDETQLEEFVYNGLVPSRPFQKIRISLKQFSDNNLHLDMLKSINCGETMNAKTKTMEQLISDRLKEDENVTVDLFVFDMFWQHMNNSSMKEDIVSRIIREVAVTGGDAKSIFLSELITKLKEYNEDLRDGVFGDHTDLCFIGHGELVVQDSNRNIICRGLFVIPSTNLVTELALDSEKEMLADHEMEGSANNGDLIGLLANFLFKVFAG